MSDCPYCNQQNALAAQAGQAGQGDHVPDFATHGFAAPAPAAAAAASPDVHAAVAAQLANVHALKLSVCVGASYNPTTNKICFQIPIYGNFCVTSPIHIPVGGQLKVCAQTCGSIIPTGLKATIYLNGNPIFNVTLFGLC